MGQALGGGRDRIAMAVFQAIMDAEEVERSGDAATRLNVPAILDGLALVSAALLVEMGVGASDAEAALMTGGLAETIRRRLREVHAFRLETGYTLFAGREPPSGLASEQIV